MNPARVAAAFLAITTGLLAAPAWAQKSGDNDCDVKKTVNGTWCRKCSALLKPDGVDKKTQCCKACGEKPIAATVCLKRFYRADCHPDKTSTKPITCCKKKHDKPIDDCALVVLKCAGCGAASADKKEVTHEEDCRKKKLVKSCSKSGSPPHTRKK